jgi:hypothetical protein
MLTLLSPWLPTFAFALYFMGEFRGTQLSFFDLNLWKKSIDPIPGQGLKSVIH